VPRYSEVYLFIYFFLSVHEFNLSLVFLVRLMRPSIDITMTDTYHTPPPPPPRIHTMLSQTRMTGHYNRPTALARPPRSFQSILVAPTPPTTPCTLPASTPSGCRSCIRRLLPPPAHTRRLASAPPTLVPTTGTQPTPLTAGARS